VDIFAGYSYLSPHGTVNVPGIGPGGVPLPVKYSSVDYGALGSVAYYFNRYVGGQVEVGSHPDGNNDGFTTASLGFIVRYPGPEITPFAHALGGAVRGGGPYHEPYTWGPALTVGGGLDYAMPFFGGHVGLRLFQVDYEYFHINFGPVIPPPVFGGRANVDNVRASAGLLLHLGSIVPPPPVTYSCVVSPTAVFQGDPVTITGTALNLNPKKTATYTWTGTGVKGDSTTATVDTSSLAPGTYNYTGHVSESLKVGRFADCTATVTVKPFDPPVISCSANPSTIKPGDSSTITSTASQGQNRPLTYTYSASAGSVSGTGTTATLTTEGAPAGPITVTCDVADDKGGKAESTTTVTIEKPVVVAPPVTKTLCSIQFEHDAKRPARVDNEAKGCLDDVALALQQSSDASAVVVGSAEAKEKKADALAAQRAVNTKAYLVTEKGIDASRITVKTGDAGTKEVKNYLVPAGATFDTDVPGTKPVDEMKVKAQARTAPAKKKVHKKAAAAQ